MKYLYTHYEGLRSSLTEVISTPNRPVQSHVSFNAATNTFLLGLSVYPGNFSGPVSGGSYGTLAGWYAGLFIGALQQVSNYTNFVLDVGPNNYHDMEGSLGGITQVNGGLNFGYGTHFGAFYLGAAVSLLFGSSNVSVDQLSDNAGTELMRFNINNYFAADLKPGLLIHHSNLLYALVGAGLSRLRTTFSYSFDATPRHPEITDSVRLTGLRLGLGFMTKITKNMAIGIQDVYTFYKVRTAARYIARIGGTEVLTVAVTPRTNNITLHWDYILAS